MFFLVTQNRESRVFSLFYRYIDRIYVGSAMKTFTFTNFGIAQISGPFQVDFCNEQQTQFYK